MKWFELPRGAWGIGADLADVDPCLVWADGTAAADFVREGVSLDRVAVIAAMRDKHDAGALRRELAASPGGDVPGWYPDDARHCTAALTPGYLKRWAAGGHASSVIERLELQLSVLPQRPRPVSPTLGEPRPGTVRTEGTVLLGVVDSGCPFAHRALRHAAGGTRVLALWDQASGRDWMRHELNALMDAATTRGALDEAACYAAAGLANLRHRIAHGAGVLDLLTGPMNYGRRTSSRRDGSVPGYAQGQTQDPASRMDLVFVDLPADAAQDSSSASLPRHLLDGLRYILSFAGPQTQHVVVNISDGTSRGSHDGQSLIEQALAELVDSANEAHRGLHLVLPAGNAFAEQRHAQFGGWRAGVVQRVGLQLPPDSESPAWCFVQVPNALAPHLSVRLLAPGGAPAGPWVKSGQTRMLGPDAATPSAGVVYPATSRAATMTPVLLVWRPSALPRGKGASPPCGRWTVELKCDADADTEVHAFICRNQTNLGALARGQQARFADQAYDPSRHLRPAKDDPAAPRSPVRRRGTLNGLATGDKVVVAGGVRMRELSPADYSATGAGAQVAARSMPDGSAASDENAALDGLHVAGTHSGAVVRLRGTSFAAPQVARALANQWAGAKTAPQVGVGQTERTGPLLHDV